MVIRASHLLQRLWEQNIVKIPPEMFQDGELLVVNDCNAELLDRDDQPQSWWNEMKRTM
jgi:hypothetical protein